MTALRFRETADASQMALSFELSEPTALAEGGSFIYVSIKKPEASAFGSQSECHWALAPVLKSLELSHATHCEESEDRSK